MPCNHKFIEDLNLENLDFEPTTLIIGTFNPAWPENNTAQWFYGRTRNNYFWDVLPKLYQQPALRNLHADEIPVVWKMFCKKHEIAITDLISSINDADEANVKHQTLLGKFEDPDIAKNFKEFELTDVVGLLKTHKSIRSVYLTTKAQITFFNEIWNKIESYCLENKIHCRRLLTPSGGARFQVYSEYVPKYPVFNGVLANYILESWYEDWHEKNALLF